MIIAVDFDGTLCESDYPKIGQPIHKTINYIKERQRMGDIIILWTCRQGEYLTEAVAWSLAHGIKYNYINENYPDHVAYFGSDCRKIFADIYIDDKSINPNREEIKI